VAGARFRAIMVSFGESVGETQLCRDRRIGIRGRVCLVSRQNKYLSSFGLSVEAPNGSCF
jgi:hypothetical protein